MIEKYFRSPDFFIELPVEEYSLTVNERADGPALQSHAVPRGPATFCLLILVTHGLLLPQVDQDKIGVVTLRNPTFTHHVPDSSRRVAHPMNHAFQRTDSCIDAVEHQSERILNGGQPRWGFRVRLLLLFESMRSVIRGNDLDSTFLQRLPQSFIIRRRFDRRIHLNQRTQTFIIVDVEEQVVRTDFSRNQPLGIS